MHIKRQSLEHPLSNTASTVWDSPFQSQLWKFSKRCFSPWKPSDAIWSVHTAWELLHWRCIWNAQTRILSMLARLRQFRVEWTGGKLDWATSTRAMRRCLRVWDHHGQVLQNFRSPSFSGTFKWFSTSFKRYPTNMCMHMRPVTFLKKHVYFEKFINKFILQSQGRYYIHIFSHLCGNLWMLRQEKLWICFESVIDSFSHIFKTREALLQKWDPHQFK